MSEITATATATAAALEFKAQVFEETAMNCVAQGLDFVSSGCIGKENAETARTRLTGNEPLTAPRNSAAGQFVSASGRPVATDPRSALMP